MSARPTLIATLVALVTCTGALAGCGGGGEAQDANEPEGEWRVRVTDASFPGRQRLADRVEFRITVSNEDTRAIPNLAVTVDGFSRREEDGNVSDPNRPIWVIEEAPENATTAYTNTWAVGAVPAGQTRTLTWKVAAVRAGTYSVRWRVAAGLDGKAKAVEDGDTPSGSFIARVSEKPNPPQVD